LARVRKPSASVPRRRGDEPKAGDTALRLIERSPQARG